MIGGAFGASFQCQASFGGPLRDGPSAWWYRGPADFFSTDYSLHGSTEGDRRTVEGRGPSPPRDMGVASLSKSSDRSAADMLDLFMEASPERSPDEMAANEALSSR